MSLYDDIRAMLVEKEEENKRKAEQQQLEQEEQRRLSAEFQENYLLLFDKVVVPKLGEVQAALIANGNIEATVGVENSNSATLIFLPRNNVYGKQYTVRFYGSESSRVIGVYTASGSTPDDPLRDEQQLSLSDATPEWFDNYLKDFIGRVLNSGQLI